MREQFTTIPTPTRRARKCSLCGETGHNKNNRKHHPIYKKEYTDVMIELKKMNEYRNQLVEEMKEHREWDEIPDDEQYNWNGWNWMVDDPFIKYIHNFKSLDEPEPEPEPENTWLDTRTPREKLLWMGGRFVITKNSDNYNTPPDAWELIFNIVGKNKKVWVPFYNDGSAIEALNSVGVRNVIHECKDFFTWKPDDYETIIDNPPFSIKRKVMEQLLRQDKPWALLLPMSTMERCYFFKLFGQDPKMQVVIPYNTVDYRSGSTSKHCPFKSAWFCYGFNIDKGQQIVYIDNR